MFGGKAQFSPIEVFLALLGVSILVVFLMSSEANNSVELQALRYSELRTQKQLLSTLHYETEQGKVGGLLSQQLCGGGEGVGELLDEKVNVLLSNFSRKNYNYILAVKQGGSYLGEPRYYDNESSVCLERLTLARQGLRTPCGEFTLVLGTWRVGEEVREC